MAEHRITDPYELYLLSEVKEAFDTGWDAKPSVAAARYDSADFYENLYSSVVGSEFSPSLCERGDFMSLMSIILPQAFIALVWPLAVATLRGSGAALDMLLNDDMKQRIAALNAKRTRVLKEFFEYLARSSLPLSHIDREALRRVTKHLL